MIKLAMELPFSWLEQFNKETFHFVISDVCYAHPNYLNYYIRKKAEGHTLFLDSAVFETGRFPEIEEYEELYEILQPDVIILPDIPGDVQKTADTTHTYLEKLHRSVPCQFMGILAGKTIEEEIALMSMFRTTRKMYERFTFMGVSKMEEVVLKVFNRIDLLKEIHERKLYEGFQFHLLGDTGKASDLRMIANHYPWVTGIDTSSIGVYTLENRIFTECEMMSGCLSRPKNYFGTKERPMPYLFWWNLERYKSWLNGEIYVDTAHSVPR